MQGQQEQQEPPVEDFRQFTRDTAPKDPKKELGREFLMAAQQELEFVQEPEVVSLVSKVGKELVSAAGSDPDYYHFFVVRKNEVNAFAVPGGYIFIYEGLLRNIDGIDALAGVLAHEIAHVERDHIFKDARKTGAVDLATIAGIILAGASGGNAGGAIATAEAANISYKLKLSREHEEDADMFAIRYLQKSMYNPAGLSGLFSTLAHYGKLNSADLIPPYLSTHPGVGERQVIVETLTRELPVKKIPQTDWERIVTILKAGDSKKGALNLEGEKELLSEERRHYLQGLYALKSKRLKEARTEYLEAVRINPDNPAYHADLASLYLLQQDFVMAKKEALQTIQMSADYAAPYVVLAMAAKREEKHEEAVKWFMEAERITPHDPFIHYHMAGSYYELKKPALLRIHLGRHYRYSLKQKEALVQYNMALGETRDKDLAQKIGEEIKSLEREGI